MAANDKVFLFYIRDESGRYYYADNDKVFKTTERKPLKYSPVGWDEIEYIAKISGNEWVATREVSESLRFVKDGGNILRSIIARSSFTAKAFIEIDKLDTFDRTYNLWYKGQLDLSNYSSESDYVDCNILEQGLIGLLRNREDVEYQIPFKNDDITVNLNGVKLGARASWVLGDSGLGGNNGSIVEYGSNKAVPFFVPVLRPIFNSANGELGDMIYIPMTQYSNNVQAGNFIIPNDQDFGMSQIVQQANPYNPTIPPVNINLHTPGKRGNTFVRSSVAWHNISVQGWFNVGITWDDQVSAAPNTKFRVVVYMGGVDLGMNYRLTSYTRRLGQSDWFDKDSSMMYYENIELSGYLPFMLANTDLFLYFVIEATPSPNYYYNGFNLFQMFIDDSSLNLRYNAKVTPSQTKAIQYYDFLERLIGLVTDGAYKFESEFLSNNLDSDIEFRKINWDNSPYNTVVTSGDALRSLPDSVIKTTFTEAMKDAYSRWGLVWAVKGNTFKIEPISYFFNADKEILHIDNISNLSTRLWRDRIYNEVNVGYHERNNDNVEGKNEFNTTITFLTESNTLIKQIDDITAPYRSDVYGIESLRVQTLDEDRKDNKADNDTFVIEIDPTPDANNNYNLYRTDPNNILGVDDPENIYNVALSPKRALLRHLPRLRGLFGEGVLQYQSIDRNPELESNLSSGWITEIDDINLDADTFNGIKIKPLFTHYIIEFDAAPDYNLSEIIERKNDGYLSFEYKGQRYKGFILEVGVIPATRDIFRFKLISHIDNDIKKLI